MPQFQPVTANTVAGPRLLVSVRDCLEAQAALDGGADIIDVKDPSTGPLGFAGFETISQISQFVGHRVPVSAAFGECTDWLGALPAALRIPEGQLSHGPSLGKLGLAGLLTEAGQPTSGNFLAILQEIRSSPPPWMSSWQHARQQLEDRLNIIQRQPPATADWSSHGADSIQMRPHSGWVAVAYADCERAAAPDVWSVLAAGIHTDCSILLIDTFIKDGQGTLKWLDVGELQKIRAAAHQMGLKMALAGQLTEDHLPALAQIQPDILAVRGAVCVGSDRRSAVSADRVQRLHQRLIRAAQTWPEQRD